MINLHTGDILADLLAAHGVKHLFGVPGGQTLPLYNALRRRPELQHIGMRDERNLPYAALAYARVSGRAGVLDATVGPGMALLSLGLLEALHSSTPLVSIISELPVAWHPMADMGAASQGMDQMAFLSTCTKWRGKAWTQAQVGTIARQAFQKAVAGRPGPTAVIIPEDVFAQESSEPSDLYGVDENASRYPRYRPVPEAEGLAAAAELLLAAERPVLVAGGGVLHSGATEPLRALADFLDLPVATTLTGKGSIPEDHPLALGVLGGIGNPPAEAAVRAADLVVLVGFRSAQNSTFAWTLPAPHQQVIHIDLDPEQPGRFFPASVPLVGDARATLAALLGVLQGRSQPVRRPEWREKVRGWQDEWAATAAQETASDAVPILPQRVVAEIGKAGAPGDILVADASFASGWAAMYYPVKAAGRRVVLPRGMAGLGFGLPAGIGAKVAAPDQNVFVLAGDGGFAYSLAELITLKQYGIKVISVVLNNRSWGWMEWLDKLNYQQESFTLPDVPYARLAESLGLRGVRVSRPVDLAPALADAVAAPEPSVIEVESAVWEAPILAFRKAMAEQTQAGYMGTPVSKSGADPARVFK